MGCPSASADMLRRFLRREKLAVLAFDGGFHAVEDERVAGRRIFFLCS
jgi:hypothetical protein